MNIDRIIGIIRTLKEEGGPTMSMSGGGIAGSAEAGDDPPVTKRKRNQYIYGKGYRKLWQQK